MEAGLDLPGAAGLPCPLNQTENPQAPPVILAGVLEVVENGSWPSQPVCRLTRAALYHFQDSDWVLKAHRIGSLPRQGRGQSLSLKSLGRLPTIGEKWLPKVKWCRYKQSVVSEVGAVMLRDLTTRRLRVRSTTGNLGMTRMLESYAK